MDHCVTDTADQGLGAGPSVKRPGLYIFDMDGVIYRGDSVLPFAAATISALRAEGASVFFLTNNSTRTRESYARKLEGMAIPTAPAQIMTSAYAAALYFEEQGLADAAAYVIGEEGIVAELSRIGMTVIQNDAPFDGAFAAAVVGLDREFTFYKLWRAQQAILDGAPFIATNGDLTFPVEGGKVIPGCGSLVAAVQAATGAAPRVMGKPEPYSLQKILDLAGVSPADTVQVGDRLDTDIQAGKRMGFRTVLVLTGITRAEEVEMAPAEVRPDHVIPDLSYLPGLF